MRCYLPPERWDDALPRLDSAEAHYARRVLRRDTGDRIEVFDGRGRTACAALREDTDQGTELQLESPRLHPAPSPAVELVQALPKGQKMDWIIEKCTELGVSRIRPVRTRHVVTQLAGPRAEKKRRRWLGVALAAARQCGAVWIPEIAEITDLTSWLAAPNGGDCLLWGDLDPAARPLREALERLRNAPPTRLGFVVGPEGDFAQDEREALAAAGAVGVNMGPTVLRTETAALFAVAAIRYAFL